MVRLKKCKIYVSFVLCLFLFFDIQYVNAEEFSNDIYVLEDSQIPLYDGSDDIVAYYFTLSNGGYVITNSNGSDFIEYSLEEQDKSLENDSKYYYSGPCSLYENENCDNIVENCFTNKEENLASIDFSIEPEPEQDEEAALELADEIVNLSESNVKVIEEGKLIHSTKKYSFNRDGRCGAVAAAILLRYYDDYVDTKYVKGSYRTANGEKLINLLVDEYVGKETYYPKLWSGLNRYLSDMKIKTSFNTMIGLNLISNYSKIKSYIGKDRPLIVGLTGHAKYGKHWVVATGYSTVYSSMLGYGYVIIVNDGWGNTNVRINNSYVDGCLFIS